MASSSSSNQQEGILNKASSSSGSEADPQHMMDIRKRKRMQSNRESARRSRLRKQKHLDDLTAQLAELKAQNNKISTSTNATTQLYFNMEAENTVLRAQLIELSNRLQSLNDIINCLNSYNNNNSHMSCNNMAMKNVITTTNSSECDDEESFGRFDLEFEDEFSMNSWGFSFANYSGMPTLDAFMC